MAGTVEEETAHGLALQHLAAAVAKGGIKGCGHTVTRGPRTYVCSRPPHVGEDFNDDRWRRAHGHPVDTDRHYYRPATEETP